jgi:diguanylate cyclase (GGDEF)-like protein
MLVSAFENSVHTVLFGVAGVQPTLCLTSAALLQNMKLMRRPRRAVLYATAGAILAIGELIGLLVVREIHTPRPIPAELLQERVTYIYFLLTTAVVQACLGYLLGRQTDRLAELSETDALTGLPNRRTLRRRLTYEIRRASRYRVPLSLLLLDVDGLKRINDQRGHAAGDRAIRRVAASITATLRGSDLGARWGGDEFAVVMPNATSASARRLGERLMAHLSEHQDEADGTVTISIGIAVFDSAAVSDESAEQLSRAADEALYAAKASGRNQIRAA